jgi:protein involved in ribonucleotide reduction
MKAVVVYESFWGNTAEWVEKTNIVESQRRRAAEIFSPLAKRGRN